MISLIVGTVAIGLVMSGTSLLCHLPGHEVCKPPTTMTRYTVKTDVAGPAKAAILGSYGETIAGFRSVSGLKVINNIYRLFGRLAVCCSEAEVVLFYRSTVGKGGFIEFFFQELRAGFSLLPGFLTRLQPKCDDSEPLRIHILAKLRGRKREIHFEQEQTKLLWSSDERILYRVEGLLKQEAACVRPAYIDCDIPSDPDTSTDSTDITGTTGTSQTGSSTNALISTDKKTELSCTDHSVIINLTVINPYLAVCVCLYFLLQDNETSDT